MKRMVTERATIVAVVGALVLGSSSAAVGTEDLVITRLEGETDTSITFENDFFTDPPPAHDEIQPQPSLDTIAFSKLEANTSPLVTARAAAFQSAFGINAAFAEVSHFFPELPGGFAVQANTLFDVTVQSADRLDPNNVTILPFGFVINSGQLRIDNFTQYEPSVFLDGASVSAEIRINGRRWTFEARLEKDRSSGAPTVDQFTSDSFGLNNFPNLTPQFVDADNDGFVDDVVVNIPKIEGTVMVDGTQETIPDTVFTYFSSRFEYEMEARFQMIQKSLGPPGDGVTTGLAGITDPFALGTPDDPSDDLGGQFSPLGVQFFLNGQPLSGIPIVPEPSSAPLMVLGLATALRRVRAHGGTPNKVGGARRNGTSRVSFS